MVCEIGTCKEVSMKKRTWSCCEDGGFGKHGRIKGDGATLRKSIGYEYEGIASFSILDMFGST